MHWMDRDEIRDLENLPGPPMEPPAVLAQPPSSRLESAVLLDQLDTGIRRMLEPARAAPLRALVDQLRTLL